jgi:hypothetical protein
MGGNSLCPALTGLHPLESLGRLFTERWPTRDTGEQTHLLQKGKLLPLATSLQRPLLTKINLSVQEQKSIWPLERQQTDTWLSWWLRW